MNELAFNIEYFLSFELPTLLMFIKMGFYSFLIGFFLYRMRIKKNDEEPFVFEILLSLFFLFMFIGTSLEVFYYLIDPVFLHPGIYCYLNMNFLPTGFNGMASIFFFGYLGLGFLSVGIERGSNLPTKGLISLIPFSYSVGLLLFGMVVLTMPWFAFSFFAVIVPILFFYIAVKAEGGVRNKAVLFGLGFLAIFAGEALNMNLWIRNFPEIVGFIMNGIFHHPIHFYFPLSVITGCILLIIAHIIYRD